MGGFDVVLGPFLFCLRLSYVPLLELVLEVGVGSWRAGGQGPSSPTPKSATEVFMIDCKSMEKEGVM